MQALPDIHHAGWVILYFIYGQVFFLMGLVTWLKWRRRSSLELAKSLPWLTAFGILHGLNKWGYIFIPLQALYLPIRAVMAAHLFQLLLLSMSYFCLLQFGIELILPILPRYRWLRMMPGITTFLLGMAVSLIAILTHLPFVAFVLTWDALSRYILAFPGSILAALGLLHQGRKVREMDLHRINTHLRGAAMAFLFYGLVGGLIVPKGAFFPASWLNYAAVMETLGIPVQVFHSICGLAMLYFLARSLDVFRIETKRLIEEMEHARVLAGDRERIGRDLHDGIIQSIYAAGLGLEETLYLIPKAASEAHEKIRATMERLNHTIQDIRNYIFDLRETKKSRELAQVLEDMIYNLRLDTLLEVDLQVNGKRSWVLSGEQIAHLTQIAREALSNVVRHANAHYVRVILDHESDSLCLTVADDGVGMEMAPGDTGHKEKQGLLYMQERTRLLGGEFSVESVPGQGTKVKVMVPRRS
jgi:signal transduction histidine kinase